mgnify:CR=1 FL=1
MERAISQEERIRRAEEIYSRRKSQNSRREEYATLNVGEKREYGLFKRMTIQIIACLMIYSAFYGIQNSKDIFSEQIINKAKEIMAYDVDIEQLRDKVLENVNKLKNIGVIIPVENQEVVEKDGNTNTEEINLQAQTLLEQGAKTLMEQQDTLYKEEASSVSQIQEDADYIKQNYSFIKPIEGGTISSRFGTRNPTTPTVPKYHTGIDIATDTGTIIVSAMDGKVTQVSSVGDYGKHLRIVKGEITTLYAHCSKIYVKEGDTIKQGQKIAEVGATGNVTGPHLHFEIRRNNEFVDPDYVLEF